MSKWMTCVCLSLLMALVAVSTQAQEVEPMEKEKALLNRLEELEKRVSQLEAELRKTQAGPKVPLELHTRMQGLEKEVKKVAVVEEELKKIAAKEDKPDTFRVFWKEGLNLETADSAFTMKIGGRIHFDNAWTSGDDELVEELGPLKDDEDSVSTFSGGQAKWQEVYVGLLDLPVVGNIRIGHVYEPFGLEEQTSSNYITFTERSLLHALTPDKNSGFLFYKSELEDRMTCAVGVFKDTDDVGDRISDGEYNFTARLTGLPWYEDKGRKLLHIGAAYSHRNPNDDKVRLRERPEVHISPRYVDTHDIKDVDDMDLVGAEAALLAGPFSLQGEYMNAMLNTADGTDPTFSGFYAMASYFLTGENRGYKGGLFSRVKPKKSFGTGGPGAREVAARYSHLNLTDEAVEGGKPDDITVALNWYLNPNTRFMFDYVHADLDEVGQSDTFQMRDQVDF